MCVRARARDTLTFDALNIIDFIIKTWERFKHNIDEAKKNIETHTRE